MRCSNFRVAVWIWINSPRRDSVWRDMKYFFGVFVKHAPDHIGRIRIERNWETGRAMAKYQNAHQSSGTARVRHSQADSRRSGRRHGMSRLRRVGGLGIAFCYLLVSTLIHGQHTCLHHCECANAHPVGKRAAQCSCSCPCCCAKSKCACAHDVPVFSYAPPTKQHAPDLTKTGQQPVPSDGGECLACRYLSTTLSPGLPPPIAIPEVSCVKVVRSIQVSQSPPISLLRPTSRAPPVETSLI